MKSHCINKTNVLFLNKTATTNLQPLLYSARQLYNLKAHPIPVVNAFCFVSFIIINHFRSADSSQRFSKYCSSKKMTYFHEDVLLLIIISETAEKEQNLMVDVLFPAVLINFLVYLLTNCYRKMVRIFVERSSLINAHARKE